MVLNKNFQNRSIHDVPPFFGNREEIISLEPGFDIILGDFYLKRKKDFHFQCSDDVCEFVFVLSGQFRNRLDGVDDIKVKPLFSALWLTPKVYGLHQCLPGLKIQFVCVRIKRKLLKKISGEFLLEIPKDFRLVLEEKENRLLYKKTQMTIPMESAARQIFNCRYKGAIKKLFLKSKALELISHFMALEFTNNLDKDLTISLDDKKKIETAKNILIENMENPLPLSMLSKKAGISESKLTRGFRKVYNTSVFEYLRNHRMEKAKILLESGEMNITQISYIIGYSSPSHFTRVFTKYYGLNPRNYMKK